MTTLVSGLDRNGSTLNRPRAVPESFSMVGPIWALNQDVRDPPRLQRTLESERGSAESQRVEVIYGPAKGRKTQGTKIPERDGEESLRD